MTGPKAPQPHLFHSDHRDPLGRRRQQRWIEADERRAAARRAFEALPDEEKAAIYGRIDRLLFGPETIWKIARSMPENPHSYAHRRNFKHDDDFGFLVRTFRAGAVLGCERQKFPPTGPAARWYDTFVRAHPVTGVVTRFWFMNWDLNDSRGRWLTVILNKKPTWETDV